MTSQLCGHIQNATLYERARFPRSHIHAFGFVRELTIYIREGRHCIVAGTSIHKSGFGIGNIIGKLNLLHATHNHCPPT